MPADNRYFFSSIVGVSGEVSVTLNTGGKGTPTINMELNFSCWCSLEAGIEVLFYFTGKHQQRQQEINMESNHLLLVFPGASPPLLVFPVNFP